MYVQGYFSYDSKKSGGTTVSHLRFGNNPIRSSYLVYNADYVACHNKAFLYQYDLLKGLKNGGTFVLNCPWDMEDLEERIPASIKSYIANNNIKFYIIDAMKIASEVGLGNRINMAMQSVFFKLADVIPIEKSIPYLKDHIKKMYGRKGQDIVDKNFAAVDKGLDSLIEVKVPSAWADAKEIDAPMKEELDFVKNIQRPMARHEGDELPVSAFIGMEDGTFPLGTTAYEKRGIAPLLPEWQIDKCIQCGQCSFVCPHATIRLILLDDEENKRKPDTFKTKDATGKDVKGLQLRVQVSPLDCTGCGNCADVCSAKGKALIMKPAEHEMEMESENWEFAMTVTSKAHLTDITTLRGSQFSRPLLEFNGACLGCGETPYIRLLTQLFGDRMVISNATGCSSIWGASAPSIAYTTTSEGKGPAWINPLFEDAAEFGYGMYLGAKQAREKLAELITESLNSDIEEDLKKSFQDWLDNINDGDHSKELSKKILELTNNDIYKNNKLIQEILNRKDHLIKRSYWAIGGDGWSYDIGYGGLDHVLAMGANMNHTIKTIKEAESFNGPSLIIAYSPCISHGIRTGMGTSIMEERRAVESGYWHLYRYNPDLRKEGKNPFILDSKEPSKDFKEFITGEIRYSQLKNVYPNKADELYNLAEIHAVARYKRYKSLSENNIL